MSAVNSCVSLWVCNAESRLPLIETLMSKKPIGRSPLGFVVVKFLKNVFI